MSRNSITRLLLVEDNPGDARMVSELFDEQASHSFELTLVESMSEAEKQLVEHTFDIVLLDLGLPDAQGLETVRRAQAVAPRVPLVVLTGLDDESVALQALHEGAQDYLVKGQIETRMLLRALRYAIERKTCEEALCTERERSAEGWARLAAIHEATPDLVTISDPEGRLLYVNRGGRRMLGLEEKADITGYVIADFLPNATTHVIATEGIATAVRDGTWTGETEMERLDGSSISISQIILAHKRADGSLAFLSCIARDITERKQASYELYESERRFSALLGNVEMVSLMLDTNARITYCNDYLLRMTGWQREEIIGRDWFELFIPSDCFTQMKEMFSALLADLPFASHHENEILTRSGGKRLIQWNNTILRSPAGEVIGTASIGLDITDGKEAEARLRLQSAALNAAANAMVITERDLTIVWMNPAFTELTGYAREEALGRNVRDLLRSGFHDEAFYKQILDTILAGKSWSGEITNRRKDGRPYPEASIITPVKDEHDTITHFISIKTDLTAHRQMEAQLRQAQKMEAVGQLAAGVAHEFNNLLQALMSMAAIMRLRAGTAEFAKIGTEMEVQIKRGASLTQQLLLFSRSHAIEKSDLDLREQVQKASVLLQRLIPETIRIMVETSSERLSVQGDAGQMQQVLLNLAINARDAMPDGGTLTLRSGSSVGEVFFEVEDTGDGMDEATRAHLFEPFFTTKDVGKGTGLGLAVVHGIVEQHGGRIKVDSRPGEGSRFRIILPTAHSEGVFIPEPRIDAKVPLGSGRVLLVEDEDGVRSGIAVLLEMIGYDVTMVASGEEAIAIPMELAPELMLSDVTLPGIAGLALGERLRERWPSLKVVLMSGYIEEGLRANASARGWHFLQKPFELTDLASHLREALDGKIPGTAPVSELATALPLIA